MNTPTLAIVIPCYNEELCIKTTVDRLLEVMSELENKDKISSESYIYLVDDGSTDNTWQIIEELHNFNKRVKGLKFIKNYGNQKALIAGYENVCGLGCDCAVSIDADLQDDINSNPEPSICSSDNSILFAVKKCKRVRMLQEFIDLINFLFHIRASVDNSFFLSGDVLEERS